MKDNKKSYQVLLFLFVVFVSFQMAQATQRTDQGIAVIGWGSLIWNPEDLKTSAFHQGGPKLPIAFSRVSGDGRLTLVIDPQSEGQRLPRDTAGRDVETWYAKSEFPLASLNEAIKNLRTRERCAADCVGYVNIAKKTFRITQLDPTTGEKTVIRGSIRVVSPNIHDVDIVGGSGIRKELLPYLKGLVAWTTQQGLGATIWTDLQRNFEEKTGIKFNRENATTYLARLQDETLRKALEYIKKTPANILHATRDGDYFLQQLQ